MPTPYYPSRWLITTPDRNDDPNVFPYTVGQTFLQRKTPLWSTDVKISVSGKERRRPLWSYPVWRYSVAYNVLRDAPTNLDLQRLYAFFNSMQGQAGQFQYYDHSDNAVIDEFFATGDGVTTVFQSTRSIAVGGISCVEPVFAFDGAPAVKVNGVATAVTLPGAGRLQFAVAPAVGARLSWTGGFFFVCRFESDEMDISQLMEGLWAGRGVDFKTVKQ